MDTREIAKEYRMSHWAGIMQERISSGVSIKAFCQTAGIRENVYFYWQRKLREAACRDLMPVHGEADSGAIVPKGWAVCEPARERAGALGEVGIEIGKCRISVDAGISAEQLEKVCKVLMKLC